MSANPNKQCRYNNNNKKKRWKKKSRKSKESRGVLKQVPVTILILVFDIFQSSTGMAHRKKIIHNLRVSSRVPLPQKIVVHHQVCIHVLQPIPRDSKNVLDDRKVT